MSIIESVLDSWNPGVLSALRIITAYLFLQHGTAKLFQVPRLPMFDQLRVLSRDGVAGMLEIAGGSLLLLGRFTRPIALVLSGEMAIGYLLVHVRQGHFFMPALNEGEEAVLYCFLLLFIAIAGAGPWSMDALFALK
jgi:putative oxidoreductase